MGNLIYTFVIYPLTQLMELAFSFGNKIFDNTGIAILCVSFAVSLFTLPLYVVAEGWQQVERDVQKKMKPWISHIKRTFKSDEQYMMLSTYYRLNRYHPIMALRSAFGLLIQIPFFTAAYSLLSKMPALHGQAFLFIRDMGRPDALFEVAGFAVNVLPIAMTLINMVSGFLYTRGLSLRDKLQTYGLALVFVVILYDSPAGLVMYWTMNNIFSLIKNVFYKLKNPIKTLYFIMCGLVTIFIVWLFADRVISPKRAVLVAAVFSLVYFAPLIVKACQFLIDSVLVDLRDNPKKRLALFSFCSLGLFILNGILIPSLLIASSPMEFSGIDGLGSPTFFIRNTAMQAFGLFVVWPCLLYFLYRQRMQTLIAFAFSLLLSFALANAFLFKENYGLISTMLVFISVNKVDSKTSLVLLNLLVMAVLFVLVSLALAKKKTVWANYFFAVVAASLLLLSATQIRTIGLGYKQYLKLSQNGQSKQTVNPIFHFSKTGKNVVLLYLDRAQNRFVEPVFDEIPGLRQKYKGFTLFKNTVSFNGHTLMGAAPVFGGYEYTPEGMNNRSDVKLVDKQNQALTLLPRIFTEQAQDFCATVTDSPWANYAWIPDLSIYDGCKNTKAYHTDKVYLNAWYKEHNGVFDAHITSATLKRNLLWHSLFKTSPLALRPAFYNDGRYWAPHQATEDMNGFLEDYSALSYIKRLTDFECQTKNAYINFTNNTPHDDLFLQAPQYVPVTNVTDRGSSEYADDPSYPGNAASLILVGDWLDYLRQNGVYDNTRIVIVADHGAVDKEAEFVWDSKFEKIKPGHFHPLLMFKDFGGDKDFCVDDRFMTNADTPALLLQGIVDAPKNPYTGALVDSSQKQKGALVCQDDSWMPHHLKSEYVFKGKKGDWVRVKDNIFDSNNWSFEGQPQGEN
ncbi:MAG: YidC/Oxa1 family membrane protein insertase [Treponema sp.]|nr:YidC/Oxa1 family membrane protein insertase [Treponema sp.]